MSLRLRTGLFLGLRGLSQVDPVFLKQEMMRWTVDLGSRSLEAITLSLNPVL